MLTLLSQVAEEGDGTEEMIVTAAGSTIPKEVMSHQSFHSVVSAA